MGMDYRYSGSASYSRFSQEMDLIDKLVQSDDVIFTSWIANPYKELSVEDTEHIFNILVDFVNHHPDVELPNQPLCEIEESLTFGEGWCIHR